MNRRRKQREEVVLVSRKRREMSVLMRKRRCRNTTPTASSAGRVKCTYRSWRNWCPALPSVDHYWTDGACLMKTSGISQDSHPNVSFFAFWGSVEPSASRAVCWSKARRTGIAMVEKEVIRPNTGSKLQLIDEFFMFCLCVAASLRERVLAEVFGVSASTVSWVLITWSNYLYLVLGSVQIWMTQEQVRRTMPVKFQQRSPNLRVIVDCTEIRCESAEAITLQSETGFSNYRNYTTIKALIGIAPCGAVTFVSKLFSGSICVKELTKQSGILELLEPGDDIMADKGVLVAELLEDVGAKLIVPPFKPQSQFSKEETERIWAMSGLHILAGRAFRQIKENRMWDSPVSRTFSAVVLLLHDGELPESSGS